jgi:hypothetical protein
LIVAYEQLIADLKIGAQMSTLAKKIFAFASALAMVVTLAPVASAAVHAAGTNVNDNNTIRFVDNMGQTRAYTSAGAFLSYGFNSWSSVVPASAEDLALPRGSFVAPMPGSLINDKGTVYLMVDAGNGVVTRSGFTTPANFLGLGYSWSNVMAGDTSFLTANAPINSTTMAHSAGTLVNQDGTVYLMTPSGKMGIPSLEVFNSWGFSFSKVVAANSYDRAIAMSSGIMPARVAGQLYPSQGTVVVNPPVGSVSVGLASSNPAASTLVAGQATADLAHFNFMGNGTVTSITLNRTGVSADTTLSNVYLFDGATRLTDAASVSSGMITFTGLNIAVNGSKVISVRSDIAASTSGQTVGVALASAMTGSTAVTGTPVSGNVHTIATATLATVAVGTPTSTTSTDPVSDVNVWQSDFSVGTRDVVFSRMALRQIESISSNDIRNFRLLVDGVQVASQQNLDANGYVTFSGFSKTLTTGTRQVKVLADVIGGSSRNIKMSLRNKADLDLRDSQYNVNITATGTFPAQPSSATAVNSGSITVTKAANSASGTVTKDASNVTLGTWVFTAYGEPVKVENLNFAINTSGTDTEYTLRNGKVMVNGSQVGSTTALVAAGAATSAASFTTNFTVNPGSPVTVSLVADIYDEEDAGAEFVANDTIQAVMLTGSSNGTKQVSLGTVNVPSADVAGNTLTVSVGSLAMSKTTTYTNQTTVDPVNAYKIASYQIAGNSTEDVNVHTISADIAVTDNAGADVATIADVTDVYFKINGTTTTSVKPTVSATGNTWSVSFTVPKNGTATLDMYANLGSDFTATDTVVATVTVTGTTTASSTSVNTGAIAGQTITVGSGSVSLAFENSTGIQAKLIPDNQNDVTTSAYRISTLNDGQTLQDLTVTVTTATTVNAVEVYADGTLVASKPGATSVSFNDLGIVVGANSSRLIEIKLDLGAVTNTTGLAAVTTSITAATAAPASTGVEASVTPSGTGNTMYVFAATPVITAQALPTTSLANGTQTIAKFSVTSNGGPIAWKAMDLAVSKTTTITGSAVQLFRNGSLVATTAETIAAGTTDTIDLVLTNEESVSGTVTYEVRATLANVAADNFFTTSLSGAETAQESAAYAGVAGSNFVWSDVVGDSDEVHSLTSTDWHNDYLVVEAAMSWTLDN